MATKNKGKIVPCEGCRERKKKCSADQPCERCKRLGIQCYYLQPTVNENVNSKARQELQIHVEVLEDILKSMERELCHLKLLDGKKSNVKYQLDDEFDDTTTTQQEELEHVAKNWQITFGKYNNNISVQTDITSFETLLQHIQHLLPHDNVPLVKQPTLATLSVGGGYLRRHKLNSYLRKGLFTSTLDCVRKVQHRQINYNDGKDEGNDFLMRTWKDEKPIAIKLLEIYFSCRFLHRVLFHQKTFWDLFVDADDPEQSPVVCAVCAALLTMHCKHVLRIIPYDQQIQLGEYFFHKARQLMETKFDDISLETLTAYLHMGIYKANLLRPEESNLYLELALRIRQLLADDVYKYPPNQLSSSKSRRFIRSKSFTRTLGEWETFKRLHTGFQDVIQFIEFVNNERGVPVKGQQKLRKKSQYEELFKQLPMDMYKPTPLPDESRQTVRAIMKEHFVNMMVKVVGPYFFRVRFGDDDMIPLSLLMTTEENLKNFYYHQLPLDYQLSPFIFEDGIDDVEFRKRLDEDGRCDIASVTIAARFYQSQLALHEPFLPILKRPKIDPKDCHSLMAQYNNTHTKEETNHKNSNNNNNHNNNNSNAIDLEEENEEDEDENVISVHALRAQEVCFKTAIIVVRLLEYQSNVLEACTIPTPSLLTAWDIHLKNSCLGMTEQEIRENDYLSARDVKTSREYALRCIDVLKRGYLFNFAERYIWEYYRDIENQLLQALYLSNPPQQSANYWEPHQM